MTAPPLVSIVTLNYNQTDVTCAFLESARHLTYPNVEILVVDNGSVTNPTAQIGRGNHPHVRLLLNAENLGFTGGNNVGIAAAKGEFLFIVNNDTELTPDLLERLLEPFENDERVGVVCPKIRDFYQPDVIEYAGYSPLNKFTGQMWPLGNAEVDQGQFDQSGPTAFAYGCAMMVKREVVQRVGGFAEQFFLYYEELDWSQRIRNAGFEIYYQSAGLIFHKGSASMGKFNPLKVYYLTRNRVLFMRRHAKPLERAVFYAYFACLVLPKHVLTYSLRGQFHFLKAFLKGVWWNLTTVRQLA